MLHRTTTAASLRFSDRNRMNYLGGQLKKYSVIYYRERISTRLFFDLIKLSEIFEPRQRRRIGD